MVRTRDKVKGLLLGLAVSLPVVYTMAVVAFVPAHTHASPATPEDPVPLSVSYPLFVAANNTGTDVVWRAAPMLLNQPASSVPKPMGDGEVWGARYWKDPSFTTFRFCAVFQGSGYVMLQVGDEGDPVSVDYPSPQAQCFDTVVGLGGGGAPIPVIVYLQGSVSALSPSVVAGRP